MTPTEQLQLLLSALKSRGYEPEVSSIDRLGGRYFVFKEFTLKVLESHGDLGLRGIFHINQEIRYEAPSRFLEIEADLAAATDASDSHRNREQWNTP